LRLLLLLLLLSQQRQQPFHQAICMVKFLIAHSSNCSC
jgi:hypothetical protein